MAQNPTYAFDNLSLQMMVSLDRTPYLWRQEEEEVTEITHCRIFLMFHIFYIVILTYKRNKM